MIFKFLKALLFIGLGSLVLFIFAILYQFWMFKEMVKGRVNDPNPVTEIPFKYNESGHIQIEVTINGENYPFLVDSGASNILVKGRGPVTDSFRGFGIGKDSNGSWFLSKVGMINEMLIGDLSFEELRFETVETNFLDCPESAVGLIGKETMMKSIWQFLPDEKLIRIAPKIDDLSFGKNIDSITLHHNKYGHQLSAKLKVKNHPSQKLLVDTGYNGGFTLSADSSWDQRLGKAVIGSSGSSLKSESITNTTYWYSSNSARIVDYQISDSIDMMVSNRSFAALGLGFLRRFNFALDWNKNLLYLERLPEKSLRSKYYGIGLESKEEGGVTVEMLVENLPPHQAGISIGQRIESINGYLSEGIINDCELNEIWDRSDTLRLSYYQEAVQKNLELTPNYIFP